MTPTAISDQTRQYWLDTVLGWAEDRLMPPQFEECKRALEQVVSSPTAPGKCEMLTWVFNALVGVIDNFNDLQAEPGERGRGNDLLCIILSDDGSGQVGTHYEVLGEINPQEGPFKTVDDWVNYFDQWIDPDEWRDARP